jgi:hypothetical protein
MFCHFFTPQKVRKNNKGINFSGGFSFIDILVGTALFLLAFIAIAGVFRLSVALIAESKARIGALSLAQERVEFIRSMVYADIGTVGGIPTGVLPQTETVSLNGITYTRKTLVLYYDNPADGTGDEDENGITTDHKKFAVTVVWSLHGKEQKVRLSSIAVPNGIETSPGGGTLIVNVANATSEPLAGATVHVENIALFPQVSMDVVTDDEGRVMVDGSPSAAEYHLTVTKSGYTTAQTYSISGDLSAPVPGHASVFEGRTTVFSFQIDKTASVDITTFRSQEPWTFADAFNDVGTFAVISNVVVEDGYARLADEEGVYFSTGDIVSSNITPEHLLSWTSVDWVDNTPEETHVFYHIYAADGVTLIPDTFVSGNAAGFSTGPLDLSAIPVETYPVLRIGATLSTDDSAYTPSVSSWTISALVGPVPLPNVAFTWKGKKTKGNNDGTPVYLVDDSLSTDSAGEIYIDNLVWDLYTATFGTIYDIVESCPLQQYNIAPDTHTDISIVLDTHTAHSLRVVVLDSSSVSVAGASVRLSNAGYDSTQITSTCGQAFFPNLHAGTYTLEVLASGYQATTMAVPLDGTVVQTVILSL